MATLHAWSQFVTWWDRAITNCLNTSCLCQFRAHLASCIYVNNVCSTCSASVCKNIIWIVISTVLCIYKDAIPWLVSFSDPALKEGKSLAHIERFLGCTGCSISCDWHDNTLFWHGNASTTLTRCSIQLWGDVTIITCRPHGVNLIGALKFLTETSSSPRKRSMCTRPFPSLRVGSGNETMPWYQY